MTGLQALRASGLLRAFGAAGLLVPADVHVALRLGEFVGEPDERVLLAIALTVRNTRHGSVVLDLADAATTITPDTDDGEPVDVSALPWPAVEAWVAACAASPVVRDGGPLHLVGARLWLDRYWQQEAFVAADLRRRSADRPADVDMAVLDADLDALFPDAEQRRATRNAVTSRVSVIGGGPGTGKTTTIARLVTTLRRQRPTLRIALAAPTGKAAARLQEAVELPASTLHRLLGSRPDARSRFRHDRDNRLPFDAVVVDECSMVSLTMMTRLLEALPPTARLVLVGDPDQLASVEAGAVLSDLVDGLPGESVAMLRTVYRFEAGGSIARLAARVRDGQADEALEMLRAQPAGIAFHPAPDDAPVSGAALQVLREQTAHELAVIEAARSGDVPAALDALDRHRMLCAHRSGPRGVQRWSDAIERWLTVDDPQLAPRLDGRYAGQPLLVTSNDYENGLFNGDTGVVVQHGDDLVAAFRRGGTPVLLPLVRLADVRPMHVMTVHRAQGSQFKEVTVLLPPATSPLATRQTFYTAITRASERVRVIGSEEAVLACVNRPAARATGLRDRLTGRLG
ncbi:MAG TPA: exodeoxyribonuclease V subunit alpha [Jatrophihabitans sp.]|jgi:exodeoxyribonuclease V alpha subunit|nr:exodeoxyribonuclease V subunit alpha [Jatrophihabitans sp.]